MVPRRLPCVPEMTYVSISPKRLKGSNADRVSEPACSLVSIDAANAIRQSAQLVAVRAKATCAPPLNTPEHVQANGFVIAMTQTKRTRTESAFDRHRGLLPSTYR